MKLDLLKILRSPLMKAPLDIIDKKDQKEKIDNGYLINRKNNKKYPIINGIPRFVNLDNYAKNFGFQWNHFQKTQLDSYSGHPISTERFYNSTNWDKKDLKNKWVLDIGCGSGRFAEVALEAGAILVALDYSDSVNAALKNLRSYDNFHIVQGDIYNLPFKKESFDYVYSLGVLQHTPDVKMALFSIPYCIKPKGKICVDFYEKSYKSYFQAKYLLRPVLKKIPGKSLFFILKQTIKPLLILSNAVGMIPFLGKFLQRLVPVANYNNILPLNSKQQLEWSLLDTFDWFSPEYDNPPSKDDVKNWMNDCKFNNIELKKVGHLVSRAEK